MLLIRLSSFVSLDQDNVMQQVAMAFTCLEKEEFGMSC